MHHIWVVTSLWISLVSSLALTWYAFGSAKSSRWWAFLLASILSASFTSGAISLALLVAVLPLLQLGWTVCALFRRRHRWGSIFGVGGWIV